MKIVILEGARGCGKSTLANMYRQSVPEVTLINPNGFHATNDISFDKYRIKEYYRILMDFILCQVESGLDYTLVFDRFFFTEKIFSSLYKEYDFTEYYERLLIVLQGLSKMADVHIVHVTSDTSTLNKRLLNREKVQYDLVAENLEESLNQQEKYKELFENIGGNIKFSTLNNSEKTVKESFEELLTVTK